MVGFLDKPLETAKLLELVRRYTSKASPDAPATSEQPAQDTEVPTAASQNEDYVDNAVQSGLFRIQDVPGLIDSATKKGVEEVEESARSDFRRKTQPLILQGSLASNALAEVFGKLHSEKATGDYSFAVAK